MYLFVAVVMLVGAGILVSRYPGVVLAAVIVIARAMCGVKRRQIEIDGRIWTYLDSGAGPASTVVLLHGFGADKDAWLPYARLLRKRLRVIAPDLPGFGESPMDPNQDYTVDAQGARLQQFIRHLGPATVHLAGNSLGGFIATWIALQYPELLSSVTLIDAAGMAGANKSETDLIIDRGENPFAFTDIASFNAFLTRVSYQQPWIPKVIRKALYLDAMRRQSFLTMLFSTLLQDMQSRNLLTQLHRLKVPTLVLWGREDRLVDVSAATAIHERIPSSELVILEEIGHVPMIEAPRATAAAQLRFIDGLADTPEALPV